MVFGLGKPTQLAVTSTLLGAAYACIFFFSTLSGIPAIEVAGPSLLLAAGLIMLSVWDIETYLLPDPVVVILAIGGIATLLMLDTGTLLQHSLAALAIGLLIVVMDRIYFQFRGRHGIGMGDAKLLAAGAIWIGAAGILTAILWACLTGLAHCLGFVALRQKLSGTLRIPFGPHIALGIWLAWLFGPAM